MAKTIGGMLFNLGSVLSVTILFILSPASFTWLLADTATLTGRIEQAEEAVPKGRTGTRKE